MYVFTAILYICKAILLQNFILEKDHQINTFFLFHLSVSSFFFLSKREKKKINEEQGKEKLGDLPTNLFLLCT